jgi:hypothetical protein
VAAVIAVGVGALFGGHAWGVSGSSDTTANAQTAQASGDGNRPSGMPGDSSGQFGGLGGGRNGGNMVSGSIIAVDDSGITVKTSDGSTKIILVSGSTSISLTKEGSKSDLVTGEAVVVSGTANSDGTVTASSIMLGTSLGFGGAPGDTPPSGGTAPSGSGASTTQTTAQ